MCHRTVIVETQIEDPVRNIDNVKNLSLDMALGYKKVKKKSMKKQFKKINCDHLNFAILEKPFTKPENY